ncbi:MAG: RNA methyltransferase [Bacteroidales bacterium]|nr:RNA methyltransferase [Bacteroidales bacterium]
MISKNQIKHIRSLRQLKFRSQYKEFTAEGDRLVRDLIDSDLHVKMIIASSAWLQANKSQIDRKTRIAEATEKELSQISTLTTPQQVVAVIGIPQPTLNPFELSGKLSLALDDISNPGNLGTIIRTADWFGIEHIICSNNTADAFNPKVVQASMGSIARVSLHYVDLYRFLTENELPVELIATTLGGEDVRKTGIPTGTMLIIGNEAHGINKKILFLANKKIFIPSFTLSSKNNAAESLNVAIATAIFCYEFRRNIQT